MGEDQRRFVYLLDHVGNSKSLAGAGGAEQDLLMFSFLDPFDQRSDRFRLVSGRTIIRFEFEQTFHIYIIQQAFQLDCASVRDKRKSPLIGLFLKCLECGIHLIVFVFVEIPLADDTGQDRLVGLGIQRGSHFQLMFLLILRERFLQ